MRKISLLHQIFGRHGPRYWFSGFVAFLICLVNVFSVVGIGFSLPTSQAASLAHSARSTHSIQQALQHGIHAQVSTQKAPLHSLKTQTPAQKTPQHSLKTQTPVQKTIPHKSNTTPDVRLKPHVGMIPAATAFTITDAATPTTVSVGDTVTYTLTMVPVGPAIGDVYSITDAIPAGLTLVSAVSSAPGTTAWVIAPTSGTGPLTITATYTTTTNTVPSPITITAKPNGTVFGTLSDAVSGTVTTAGTPFTAPTVHAPITVLRPDLAITKTHTPVGTTFQAGQSITYSIAVDNDNLTTTGTLPAGEVVTVTDTLPSGLTGITYSGTGWNFSNTGTTLTATYTVPATPPPGGILAGGALPPITVTGTFSAASVGTAVSNMATVSTPLDPANPVGEAEQKATDTVSVVAIPDLSASLAVTNAGCSVAPASPLVSYALTISNAAGAGPVLSTTTNPTPISVVVTPPANLTGVTLSSTSGWSFAGLTATYTGTYPVAAGTTLPIITITGTPVLPATSPVVLSAKVSIASGTTTTPTTLVDANPANDTATSTLTVCSPDLAITKTHAGTAPFVSGQNITYTITVTNTSTVPVVAGSPIMVTDILPAGLANTWAISSGWSLSIVNGTLTGTYTGTYPVAGGAVLPAITISGTLTSAAGSTMSNTATVTTPADGNLTNNSATDTFPVTTLPNTPAPDVAITFAHTGTACVANNGTVTYTLGVSNSATAGPIYAGQPVTVNATLPTNLTGIILSTSGGWQLTLSGNTVTGVYNAPVASGGILPPITIMGNLTTVNSATLTSTATVALSNDSTAANNTATDILTLCTPDLAIVKTHVGSGPFKIGTAVTFNLAVTNVGTAPILAGQSITVIDPIPSGLSSVTATGGTDWTITTLNNTVIATYSGTYPVAAAAILTPILVSGQISSLDQDALTNTATVTTPGDVNLKNNTSTDKIPVAVLAPDLSVSIDSPNNCVRKNDKASFTFWVSNDSNAGSIAASAPITLTFRVPDGLDQVTFKGSHWDWKKDGSVVTATYIHNQTINGGDDLSSFSMTGVVTRPDGDTVWVGVRAYEHDDSKRSNDIDYQQFYVCKS